jgi:hypothetical protein
MARRVFFSFHYERDIWRANVVRNSWMTHDDRESSGFWDASLWEEAKLKGDSAIKRMIDNGIYNTSVTVVLIGAQTAERKYVQYEIQRSVETGKGLLGIYIHRIKDRSNQIILRGSNPFDQFTIQQNDRLHRLSDYCLTYDWVSDDGYTNIGDWVEDAARAAGR